MIDQGVGLDSRAVLDGVFNTMACGRMSEKEGTRYQVGCLESRSARRAHALVKDGDGIRVKSDRTAGVLDGSNRLKSIFGAGVDAKEEKWRWKRSRRYNCIPRIT